MKFYEQSVKIQTDKNVEGAQAPVVFFHRKTAKKGVIVISIEMTKEECLERLLNAYSHHYDIVRDVTVEGGSYPAEAIFFLRDENYLISRKHVLNAVENHEYVYFYLTDHLDAETLRQQIEVSRAAGMTNIKPDKEKSVQKIDGIVASIMALGEWMTAQAAEENDPYSKRGMLSFND